MIDWQLVCVLIRQNYKPLEQVADELKMSRQHINRLARGEVNEPRFNSGVKLLDVLYDNVPTEQFMRVRG